MSHHEVIVIGGGQAGLAIGHFLAQQGRDFTILDAAEHPAAAWRSRWDSLRLFTPARYDSLPGTPFPGDPDHYPTRDEVVDYLSDYARRLPVELDRRVLGLRRDGDRYEIELTGDAYTADQVVVATGPFQTPRIPALARTLDPGIRQLHSADYRNPAQIPSGPVLVVGGGNTGYQIAEELSATHEVHLSVGSSQTPLPQRLFGRDIFRYLVATGLFAKTVDTRLGRRLQSRDTLIGSSPRAARRRGIALHQRTVGAHGSAIRVAGGAPIDVRTVIWATGFTVDHAWIEEPVFGEDGHLMHRRGITPSPGLYFLGLPWQHTRGSALLGFVQQDAAHLAQAIATRSRRPALA